MESMNCNKMIITGTMYPGGQKSGSGSVRELGHLCEEFSGSELDKMVEDLQGLDVLIEHNESELVGKVQSARKTQCDSIDVVAVVTASTDAGKRAIQDLKDKKLIGLSLSHDYHLHAPPGSDIARRIHLAAYDGRDWKCEEVNFDNCKRGKEEICVGGGYIRKTLKEVSLCADPARVGCFIRDCVAASKAARKDSSHQQQQQERDPINTQHGNALASWVDESIVGVFACSATMEAAPPASAEQPSNDTPVAANEGTPPAANAADALSAANEAAPATGAEAAKASKTNNRGADGRFTSANAQSR